MAKRKKIQTPETEASTPPKLSFKEQMVQKRAATKARTDFIQYTAAVCAIAIFLGVLIAVAMEPKLAVMASLAIICLAMSYKYPRYAIYVFIAYIPFSGTVVYALGGSAILQLAKDAFFIPAAAAVTLFCRKNNQDLIIPQMIKIPLIIVVCLMGVTMLVKNLPQHIAAAGAENPIALGILGIKAVLGYLLLVTCMYYLIRTKEDLYIVLRAQVLLIIIACGLGFAQYMMLRTGRCAGTVGEGNELFRASLEARCLVGGSLLYSPEHGQIRLPGTFVAPWQWGWFLISSTFFAFGTAFNDRNFIWRIIGLGAMALVAVMSLLSGQRIALALVPVVTGILLILTGQLANLKRFLPIAIGLGLILTFAIARDPTVVSERVESLQGRWEASPPIGFITHQLEWAMKEQDGIFGRGAGRATNAARTFGETALVETYHSKLLYEFGPIGLIAILGLYTALTISTFSAYRSIKEPDLRGYGASMWVFVLFISYFPYYYPLDVDPVNVYYWLVAGIVLKLPSIDRQERAKDMLSGNINKKLSRKELRELEKSQKTSYL